MTECVATPTGRGGTDRSEQEEEWLSVSGKREGMQAKQLYIDSPPLMDVMYFRVLLADCSALLLCAMYRPPRQGPTPSCSLLRPWTT